MISETRLIFYFFIAAAHDNFTLNSWRASFIDILDVFQVYCLNTPAGSEIGFLDSTPGFKVLFSSSVVPYSLWPHGLAAHQASLSLTISRSLLKLMSIESVMPSNRLILCRLLLLLRSIFPTSGYFQMSQFFESDGQSIGVSASASVLQMNIQDWFPLGLTGFISLQSKGLSRVFSSTTVQKHQFFCTQISLWSKSHIHTLILEKP